MHKQDFIDKTLELYDFVENLNNFIGCSTNKYPVAPLMLNLGSGLIKTKLEKDETVINEFFETIYNKIPYSQIENKNIDFFIENSEALFPGAPKFIVESLTNGFKENKRILSDNIDDIFELVVEMFVISSKWKIENDKEFILDSSKEISCLF